DFCEKFLRQLAAGELDNIIIAKKIIKERLDSFERIGSTELQQNYGFLVGHTSNKAPKMSGGIISESAMSTNVKRNRVNSSPGFLSCGSMVTTFLPIIASAITAIKSAIKITGKR